MSRMKSSQPVVILIGAPNSGKTTLFNHLSGKNFKTVNYPGSTIEYHTSGFQSQFNIDAILLDSPGIISVIPNSPDEEVTINSLFEHPSFGKPDLIITTADASQLSRHLLLVKQLIECGFKVVVAITMNDILKDKSLAIDAEALGKLLTVRAVKINAKTGEGISELLEAVKSSLQEPAKEIKKEVCERWNDSENLIKTFSEIEEIENKVLRPLNPSQEQLEKANKELSSLILQEDENKILPESKTLKIDNFLLHPFWGLVIFFFVMALTFASIFWLALPLMNLVDYVFAFLNHAVIRELGHTWFSDFIAFGVIDGVGAVSIFVPQIIILFLILGFLEDTGYLARGAMLIDKPLSKIGLNGRSFVPMLSGFACAVPAILAARTIPNRRERLLTIFVIPLMSCSARLPVYVLLLSFLTPPDYYWLAGLGLAAIYVISILSSLLIAAIIKRFNNKIIKAKDDSSFILELPTYKFPKLSIVFHNAMISAKAYLSRAGLVILSISVILWFLTYFPDYNPNIPNINKASEEYFQLANSERIENSFAAMIGKVIEPVMKPLGMDWRIGLSLVPTFAAREVFVSSLALIFKVTAKDNQLQVSLISAMRNAKIAGSNEPLFTASKVVGLIVFFIFALQCMSTIAVSKQETGGWRIPLLQLFIYSTLAYALAFITIHGLQLFGIP